MLINYGMLENFILNKQNLIKFLATLLLFYVVMYTGRTLKGTVHYIVVHFKCILLSNVF